MLYNEAIASGTFPHTLKLADITPSHKKDDKNAKENDRPISILSSIAKIFERQVHDDISKYMEDKLSPYLWISQRIFHTILPHGNAGKIKKALNNNKMFGSLLTELSEAFDCLNHQLLIAKLDAYGFNHKSLNIILSYLSGGKHRTNDNNH